MRHVTWTVFASLIISAVPVEGSQPPTYTPAPPVPVEGSQPPPTYNPPAPPSGVESQSWQQAVPTHTTDAHPAFPLSTLSRSSRQESQPPAYLPPPIPADAPPASPSGVQSQSWQQAVPTHVRDIQTLRDIFQLMQKEYEQILEGNKTSIERLFLESKKSEGYGNFPFYTPKDKEEAVKTMQESFDKTVKEMSKKLGDLEKEATKEGSLPVSKISKFFMEELLGKFNLLWKANATHLSLMEKQVIRTEILKQCESNLSKAKETVGKGVSNLLDRRKKPLEQEGKPADASPPQNKRFNYLFGRKVEKVEG